MSHNNPNMCKYCQKNPVKIPQSRFTTKLIYCSEDCKLRDSLYTYIVVGIIALLMGLSAIFFRPNDNSTWIGIIILAFLLAIYSFYQTIRAFNTKIDVLWYKEKE